MELKDVQLNDRCWVSGFSKIPVDEKGQNATVIEVMSNQVAVRLDSTTYGTITAVPGDSAFWSKPAAPPIPKRTKKIVVVRYADVVCPKGVDLTSDPSYELGPLTPFDSTVRPCVREGTKLGIVKLSGSIFIEVD